MRSIGHGPPSTARAYLRKKGLRDRAESIGGELDIVTEPGAGTRLVLTLPVAKGEAP